MAQGCYPFLATMKPGHSLPMTTNPYKPDTLAWRLYNTWEHFDPSIPKHNEMRKLICDSLTYTPNAKKALEIWDCPDPVPPASPSETAATPIPDIFVPYFSQLDNESGTGFRECFSSTCAMAAAFYGKVSSDDEYIRIRTLYGDTTSRIAHIDTLHTLGLNARFHIRGNWEDIEANVRKGRPTPVGWCHRGTPDNPTGAGHWSCLIGFDNTHTIHHDPYGEADMVNGGYVTTKHESGCRIRYSRKRWIPRFTLNKPNNGYWMEVWE